MPQTSSASVISVPVPDVPLLRLYVLWPPRVVSYSWYVEPDNVVFMLTVPLYWLLPVPVSMPSKRESSAPVVASVMTCSLLGVPSSWNPETTVSQASFGVPV